MAESTPLSGRYQTGTFANHALAPGETDDPRNRYWANDVGADYFKALGTRFIAGRAFADGDVDAGGCILNRSAAQALFKSELPLGQTVWQHVGSMNSGQTTNRQCRVGGIVEDAKYGSLREVAPPTVYYPFGVNTNRLFSMVFVIHAQTAPEAQDAYRRALHELAPGSPEGELTPFAAQLEDSIARERLMSVLSGFFAGLTLLLSGIGVYGLMASYVTQRTTEIGIRMTLGATRTNIVSLVLRKAASLLMMGVLAGGCLAYLVAHLLKEFLYGVDPGSPAVLITAICLMTLAGFLAALLPAWRAISTEPIMALRKE